ncbi:Ig-like domain-containing protein, partial [Flavobacterium sp. RSSA_27]|uniref:Ig-like domain-containing protein n=1 Tax=Flavobacterium sp. RSSA_27 TaxID=3447667 RepID=UPI003F31A4C2
PGSVVLSSDAVSGNQWYKDGNPINGATASTYTAIDSGSYTVISTINNCTSESSDPIVVTANATPSPPTIKPNKATTACQGDVVKLHTSSPTNKWFKDGTEIPNETSNTLSVTSSGSYTVESINPSGCISGLSAPIVVTISPYPVVDVIAGNTVVCAASTLQLTNATVAGVWTSDNTGIATVDGNGLVTGVNAGTVTISYTVTNAGGCSTTVTKSITVTPKPSQPTITAAGPTAFCIPGSVLLTSNATSGNQWYKDGTAINGATA